MNARVTVPPETEAQQRWAADPKNSVWVSANAGSGKTHVLALRVTRLLLDGTPPAKILCLTYTRAAASNMATRVFGHLAEWALLDDATLAEKIKLLEGRTPGRDTLAAARKLFAAALETPGGLKIQTIHAFCESVLHQFPLEANIAAHFSLLDGAMEAALFAQSRRDLITGIQAEAADAALAEAFEHAFGCAGEQGFEALLLEIMGKRDALRSFIDQLRAGAKPFGGLHGAFGFLGEEGAAAVAGGVWPDRYFCAELADAFLARAQAAGKAKAQEFAEQLIAGCREADPAKRLDCLRDAFLTKAGEPLKVGNIASKGVGEHFPGFAEEFERYAGAMKAALDRLALLKMLDGTKAALRLADHLLHAYERTKTGRGFLDFNDLITRTARLLKRQDAGPWVQFKLDQGIDHILLDEAQDTSPDQWAVVRQLADEFFAGSGAREGVARTLFAVGDEKQSIYSFQGAAPESFTDTRDLFETKAAAADQRFVKVELKSSFRSTADVLTAVDHVFAVEDTCRGLTRYPEPIGHQAVRQDQAGYVELWPSLGPEVAEEPDDWTDAIDHARAPAVRLAENIARTVKHWLESGDPLESKRGLRRLRAGDVMVLVRKRDRFVHALGRALKEKGIPVAGADRIRLPDHIAVKDLLALGQYLLQPDDDLSLAAVLRSPIFGMTEEQLFVLAHGRDKNQSLGHALRGGAGGDLRFAAVAAQLAAWGNEAAFKPAFEFYAAVLGRDGVRRRMVARLGHEAGEILDEFLNFCLAAEKTGRAGLQAFLAVMESAAPDIKREMDQGRDEVRIMTVHAAKGLEAPVVFLVDGGAAPFHSSHMPRMVPFDPPSDGAGARKKPWSGKGLLWRFGAAAENEFSRSLGARIREAADDEYRRLLYVGMTRAEDRLVVCGYHGNAKTGPRPDCWHALVKRGLAAHLKEHPCAITNEVLHRFRMSPERAAVLLAEEKAAPRPPSPVLPPELRGDLPAPPPLPRPLAPSGAVAAVEPEPNALVKGRSPVLDAGTPSLAIQRGLAFHKLCEMLPGLPLAERGAATERYLARVGVAWPARERELLAEKLAAIMDDPRFSPLWADSSRAEVAVAGELTIKGETRFVSGKIDRLAVTGSQVLIVDFKTNRPAPQTVEEVPAAYLAQLALYRALLRPLYPDRGVAALLVFTEGPHAIPVSEELMDRVFAGLQGAVAPA
ncbi:MAG TPA: double-strand break repair helicase AddA [Mesorhizobium sp.]|jgi:ATP-dependent helicase/nuclease subunit A|nr:double-strand break repair helicase AddA [Mesorhizobium sp.]